MSLKLIAVVNMKGGVGKTSTVISLADALAAKGVGRVLVMDVDTQATASFCLAGDKVLAGLIEENRTIDQFLKRALIDCDPTVQLRSFIRSHVSNTTFKTKQLDISLLASSTTLRASEREIIRSLTEAQVSLTEIEQRISSVLQDQIDALSGEYRIVLVDCAPGISPFTTAAIGLADLLIVPTIPDAPSFLGLAAFLAGVHKEIPYRRAQRVPHVLITRYAPKTVMAWLQGRGARGKTNHHKEHYDKIRRLSKTSEPKFKVFNTLIEETTLMPHAMSLGTGNAMTAPTYSMKYPGKLGRDLDKLSDEIMEAL